MKRWRPLTWLLVSLACFIAVFCFWRFGEKEQAKKPAGPAPATAAAPAAPANPAVNPPIVLETTSVKSASTAPVAELNPPATNAVTSRFITAFQYRLSNTSQSVGELSQNNHAILLENALIDSSKPLDLSIPDSLRAHGDPGAYLVQANGQINNAFRAELAAAGAEIVSFIPNATFLVIGPPTLAQKMGPGVTVIPWQPYFKVKSALMKRTLAGMGAPALNAAVFVNALPETKAALEKMGVTIASESRSPFGTELALQNVGNIAAVASLPGVEEVEPSVDRMSANDLTRVIMNDAPDVFTSTNYLTLSGSNVLVSVVDSWIATNTNPGLAVSINPDLLNIIWPPQLSLNGIADNEGHATHVAGIIASSGLNGPSNAVGSQIGANFRGKAPLAKIWALPAQSPFFTDAELQDSAASTNALISNNSWGYGTSDYDLAAASYDQAVRDSRPGVPGSQPMLYVFAAGNNGVGGDDGQGGAADSLLSPAVAKNVISVGASELPRNITNDVFQCDLCTGTSCTTNKPWKNMTDSANQVARFSSRGNVGIGVEGDFGRFKPDVVAPGTMVVSTRSMTWNTAQYYNPTNHNVKTIVGGVVRTNALRNQTIFVPCDSVALNLFAESVGPPGIDLPIYARANSLPNFSSYDALGTNTLLIPGPPPSIPVLTPVDTTWFYSVANITNFPVQYDITSDLVTTNSMGDYWDVLRTNLNDRLVTSNGPAGPGPYYRYESGTSMAAPAVAGTLALMEDFFTNRWNYRPSPALMKALLINGARSINPIYDFQVQSPINYQGWGLVNLTNSLPPGITNTFGAVAPMMFLDQNPTNAMATGDRRTITIAVDPAAQNRPLRVTLVWTDPPGNPAASIKLVNDLDLIVTNVDSTLDPASIPLIYFGNDIAEGATANLPWNTNGPAKVDNVNNVENIYIAPPLKTNYSITVYARAVNVNAITAHTNGIVQDYALVISSGNGQVTNALKVVDGATLSNYQPNLTTVTNQFPGSQDTSGGLLLDQHAGASSPLQDTNGLSLGAVNQNNWGVNGQITIGSTNQWHFYVITNSMGTNALAAFTNAAFATFLPPDLSVTPGGVNAPDTADGTRPEADIDLYVARGPNAWGLTNLDPAVVATADKSLSRGGTETLTYTDAKPDEVFYIGVKAEDQEAAQYAFLALFALNPFSEKGPNGEVYLHGINVPTPIPDGTPSKPGVSLTVALAVQPISVRRVVVTNILEHENFGDLFGSLKHNQATSVLNNHTFGNQQFAQTFIYEDNDENDVPGSQHTDVPGTLKNFIGEEGLGLWMLTEADNAFTHTGQVDNIFIRLDPQLDTNGIVATIQPNSFFYDFIDVPPEGTNLTVCVSYDPQGNVGLPVELFLRYGRQPTLGAYDYTKLINPPGDCLSISRVDLPPLRPGRYFVGVFNPNGTAQTIRLTWTIGLDINGAAPTPITTTNAITPLLDDASTNDTIYITNSEKIVTVNVGVVLEHPRVSDLDLTLVTPTGQRILLFENRGGLSATNMGHLNIITNFFGATAAGDAAASTNVISPVPNVGLLLIDYDFFTVPDRIDVYYDNVDIFSTTVNGAGTFSIPYGPGNGASIFIVMNQGNNPNNTQWTYTPRVVSEDFTYLTFTDDTNLTQIPIKFAIPPYDSPEDGTNFALSNFELATNGEYLAPTTILDLTGGWTLTTNDVFVRTNYFAGTNLLSMATNLVSVVTDLGTAAGGTNYLALARGSISRSIPVTPQKNYTLNYLYRGPGISGWWRGENNATDSGDPETLGNNGDLIGRFNFPAGEVGQAFAFEDSGLAFQFAGTNTYVQVRQSPSLDVGAGSGFTVEGWINPTNVTFQQPLVEWLAHVPTNAVVNGQGVSNFVVTAGPFLNHANGHYYYLLGQTNWTISEFWANALGGHLAEIDDANEQNWVYDTFAQYGGSNYTMWIGLTNSSAAGTNFVWSTGETNVAYTNWDLGQPTNCPNARYVAILGPTNALPGLWAVLNNNGFTCDGATNKPLGVVEVNDIQTNGVQFWISVTNATNPGNGRLYANIVDTNNVSHEIFSPPGLVQSNIYQHVALTYNTNTGVANLYYSGTNVATANLGVFVPKTGGDVLIGKDMSRITNNFFWGKMDEMSVYSRFLSPAEIAAIYRISATTTNRNIGKFDPAITPAESLAEAQVSLGDTTNIIFGVNKNWQVQGFTFKAASNSVPLQITGLEPGILLDSFNLAQQPLGNLYYLPEQPLDILVGSNANGSGVVGDTGAWKLEIRDARTGAISTNADLVSWQLQFILQTNIAPPIALNPQSPGTNTVPPGQIAYFTVDVPSWANFATNLLVSATTPVDLLFNQTTPPGTGAPGDFLFLNNSTAGSQLISANPPSVPPLLPGQRYYLGVRNNGTVPSTVVVQVNFDITTLTNGIPLTSRLNTNDLERPFLFNVSSNAVEATFQLLQLTGNADLVLRRGLPLPNVLSADFGSFSGSNADETIYVLTNSLPVPLSAGPWYLDVIKRDTPADITASNIVRYAVLAKELDPPAPNIIDLTNRVPVNFTAGPGAALTNFFRFSLTNFPLSGVTNLGVRFELFNQTGNGDLTVQTNRMPLTPPFLQSSRLPGNTAEIIFIHTNASLTNLNVNWFLGVPNNETNPINFTILAEVDTNGLPSFPTAEGSGSFTRGGGLGTNVYHVTNLADSGPGTLRNGLSSTNSGTIVFDVSGTITLSSPLYITNSFLTIAGQTAPGNDGVTVAGATTYVQDAHDIILRYLRFRPTGIAVGDSLQFTNVANVIVDHISAAFGTNDIVSVLNSTNVTIQWSVVAESLNTTNIASGGSEVRYGVGDVTLHHNLYADNYSGNPTIGENVSLDFVNNVIFNWGIFSGFSTNDLANNPDSLTNFLNYSANYLIAGSNSLYTNMAFWGGTTDTWIFQTNNFIDTNLNGIVDGANTSWGMFSNHFTEVSHPFAIPPTAPDEAFIAYERVLDFAGTSMSMRDLFDRGVVQRARLRPVNTSTNALLPGMISWWPAENNANDLLGGNNGTLTGGLGFTLGKVGQAFNFDSASAYISVPASSNLNVGSGGGVTIETWIKPSDISFQQPLAEWTPASPTGSHFWISVAIAGGGPGCIFANLVDTNNISHSFSSAPGLLITNAFQHVAVTYDKASGNAILYYNGASVASANFGAITLNTSGDFVIGHRNATGENYSGILDEMALYNRALSPCEIAAIYNAGSLGKQSILSNAPASHFPYLDADQDGIPDFWEITLNENPTNASSSLDRDLDGYSDLEEYLNWLGAPHGLALTNTATNVDLYVMSGNTGNLLFGVANGTNGTVYLTNLNSCAVSGGDYIAVFTPTNDFGGGTNHGFGSFSYMVTNTDTMAYFGPVTVSMFVSAVPITNVSPFTNIIVFTNPPPDTAVDELKQLTVTNTATESLTNLTLTYTVTMSIDTNAMIANGWPLNFATTNPSPVIDTNGIITWMPSEAQGPGVYIITTLVTDNGVPQASATDSFSVTVNEVNLPPVFIGTPPDQTNSALVTMVVTNAATDPDIPTNTLTYSLLVAPTGATIDTNTGVITWTPTLADAPGTHTFTTVVTDTNLYALFNNSLSATNTFLVYVTLPIGPFVFTQPAQAVTGASAQLNGMATPNGLPTMAWFEWGTNTLYGNQTTPVNVGNSFNVVYTKSQITGLVTNTAYHFRLVVSNAFAVVTGFDQILDEARVVAWGANYLGQIDVPPGLSNNVVAIAGAYEHNLALKNNGTVAAWGSGSLNQTNVPVGLNSVVAVAGGQNTSIALKSNGTVVEWGENAFNVTNVPAGLNNVVMISGGTYATLALKSSGNIVAWGANAFNVTNVPPGLSNVVEVASGSFHNLAIKNDGTVVSWGNDTFVPASATNVVAVSGGDSHSLALRKDGTVVAWGNNGAHQTDVPPDLSNVVAIAAGGFHSLALKNDGSVVAWGDDGSGETSVPVGLTNVVAISAGYLHSLALTPTLLSTNPIILDITNGIPQTNSILGGSITYYRVEVPANADAATNALLLTVNGALNVWFSTNTPPTVTNANDFLLMTNLTTGTSIVTTATSPQLVPGTTYYLGVQNTNTFTAAYAVEVDFHLLVSVPSTNTVPISSITHTNMNGTNGFLLVWFAPTNDLFQVQWAAGLPPSWTTFTNIIGFHNFIDPTNSEFEFFDDGSQTGGLGSLRFYRLILLGSGMPTLTDGTPSTNTIAPGGLIFYQVNVPTNADFATNALLSATGPLNIWFSTNSPPTVTNGNDFQLMTNVTSGSSTLGTVGAPLLIPGGIYYLGVQNTNASAVTYSVEVDFHLLPTSPSTNTVPISGIIQTNIGGTNSFLLVWFAPTNELFQVQWNPGLSPTGWTTFTNIIGYHTFIAPANSEFEFIDDGSQTGGTLGAFRFYRLILLGSGTPGAAALTNGVPLTNSIATGGLAFYQVNVPTNADFATNTLLSATGSLNIWFSTHSPPTITNAGDFLLITNAASGASILGTAGSPLLVPGGTYYLGVQNTNGVAVTNVIEVNFHLTTTGPATNTIPISSITMTNIGGTNNFLLVWYAPTNDLFQVQWNPGLSLTNWATFTNVIGYHTFINPLNSEFEFLDDGSQTGGFGPTRYYRLILLNSVSGAVIPLTNGVPLNFTTGVGLTNFFSFDVSQTNAAVLFELYNLTGNGDLTAQRSNLPVTAPYFASSTNSSTNYEQIVIRTNGSVPSINAISWFLGVPNQGPSPISYTIRAVLPTNGMLVSGLPINVAAARPNGSNMQLAWGPAVNGERYEVRTNSNLASTNWGVLTDIVVSSTSATFTDLSASTNPTLFYRIVQVP